MLGSPGCFGTGRCPELSALGFLGPFPGCFMFFSRTNTSSKGRPARHNLKRCKSSGGSSGAVTGGGKPARIASSSSTCFCTTLPQEPQCSQKLWWPAWRLGRVRISQRLRLITWRMGSALLAVQSIPPLGSRSEGAKANASGPASRTYSMSALRTFCSCSKAALMTLQLPSSHSIRH